MTDEIRSEIQKKNKLYAKAKKNKDAKEWGEFKDLRNKVTRMIRDAKNEYLAKHPEQVTIFRFIFIQIMRNHMTKEMKIMKVQMKISNTSVKYVIENFHQKLCCQNM